MLLTINGRRLQEIIQLLKVSNRQKTDSPKSSREKNLWSTSRQKKGVPDVILRSSRGMKGGFLDGVAHHPTENGRRLSSES